MCFDRDFLLFHNPKSAGTSIENALAETLLSFDKTVVLRTGWSLRHFRDHNRSFRVVHRPKKRREDISDEQWKRLNRRKDFLWAAIRSFPRTAALHKHSTVGEAKEFFRAGYFLSAGKACFVRNPYSRAYSAYRFKASSVNPKDPLVHRLRPDGTLISFEDFLAKGIWQDVLAARPQVNWHDDEDRSFRAYRVENIEAEIVDMSANSLKLRRSEIDQILERLRNSRQNVSAFLGDPRDMTPTARKYIEEIYAADFERFGY